MSRQDTTTTESINTMCFVFILSFYKAYVDQFRIYFVFFFFFCKNSKFKEIIEILDC